MAEATIDIRVFPNKEMTSVDMAELMDAALPNTGVIQGCGVHLINGVFNIDSGRLVVKGRLGVVTGGTVPPPTTLSSADTCYLLAVCDLSNNDTPFYFKLATVDDLSQMGLDTEDSHSDFNVTDGLYALTFGYCTVDPTTGLASDWHELGQATARKGWDWWRPLYTRIDLLEEINTATPTVYTDGIIVDSSETGLIKYGKVVVCRLRFRTNSTLLNANKTLFSIPAGYRPSSVLRPIVYDWELGAPYRFNLFHEGLFQTIDGLPNNKTFIMTFTYITN